MLPLLPCFKVLPLVYDESLSYYEVLCKLTNLIKEMSENIDGNFDSIQKEIEKIYNQITDLKNYVDEQDKKLSDRIDLTNERITEEIKKCHEHCEVYAKRLYDQLLDILNQYQGEMKQWVLGEIAKIPTGIPKQFAITGDPETSGLQHDIITVTRESMCDFVNSDKYTCGITDDIGIPIKSFDGNNKCYNIDTKCNYDLYYNGIGSSNEDRPHYFCFGVSSCFKAGNEVIIIEGTELTITISIKGDKFNFICKQDDESETEILEIPISNIYIFINTYGSIRLLDVCKETFFKYNFFNEDLPNGGYIGNVRKIECSHNPRITPFSVFS